MVTAQTILALDDDELTLRTYQRSFETSGHRVILTNTSDQAIDLARQHRPRLALLDVSLSMKDAKDGYAVCRELIAGQEPPPAVFLITAYARSSHDRLRAFEAGAVAFYDKFIPPMLLVEDINFFLKAPVPLLQLTGKGSTSAPSVSVPTLHPSLRAVVIDDDDEQVAAISMALESEAIEPFASRNARQGLLLIHRVMPDVVILDMNLPDAAGNDVLAALKAHSNTKDIPVIVWTGSERQGQELACMKEGASQYLIKGIHEIVALPLHVRACLKAAPRRRPASLACGPVVIDEASHQVIAGGKKIDKLTSKEFELLTYVVTRSPAIVPWTEIERAVWRMPAVLRTKTHAPKTIVVHLNELKKKLGRAGRCLITHRGHGLQFYPGDV